MHYILISDNFYSIINFTNGTWVTTQDDAQWVAFDPAIILSDIVYTADDNDSHCMLDFASIEDWIASVNSDKDCVHIAGHISTVFTEPYQLSITHPELFT